MLAEQHGPLLPTLTHSAPPGNPQTGDGYNPDVKPGLAAFLAASALPLLACSCSGNTRAEWAGPPRPDDSGRLEIGTFNAHLDASGKGTAPVVVATEFLRLD